MSRVRFHRLAGPLLLMAAAAACGESRGKPSVEVTPVPAQPKILSFAASPEVIPAGDSATLTWRTSDAVALVLADERGTEIPLGDADLASGAVTVAPTETTSYTLTATGVDGAPGPIWRTATVTVTPLGVDAPTIESFSAPAGVVPAGGEVVLSWRTTNASRLALHDDAGAEIDLAGAAVAEGQVAVRPTRSPTVYALAAIGPGGRANKTVTVEVAGLPRIANFYVDPLAPVGPGSTVALVWETVNADRVEIRRGGAPFVDTTTELSGRREIELSDSVSFDIVATGPGGTATARTMAQVGAAIVSFSASQRVVRAGDPVEFTWQLEGADRAAIDGPGGYHRALEGTELTSGATTVNVTAAGDFVLQAFRGDVARTGRIAIDLTTAPRVRAVSVDQAIVTAAASHPETVNVSWVQDGADSCTLLRNNQPVQGYTAFACGRTGTATVQVFGTSALRLVATNAAGNHSGTVDVQAIPPATIAAFASQPARRVTPGSTVQLAWTVTDAVSISMTKNGASFPVGATAFTATVDDAVDLDSVYELTAVNSLGHVTVAALTVRAGAPELLTAAATPSFVGIGDAVTLSWTADGGDTLTVTDPAGTEVLRTTDPAAIDAGSVRVLAPLTAGTAVYTVTVTNGRGDTDALAIEVVVSDGPMIRSFAAGKASISLGETLTLTWNVTNDPSGATPTLTLADNYGHTLDVSDKNPNLGSLTFAPAEEGAHVYTLTAVTAPGRTVATASAPVEITVKPVAETFTAAPNPASTADGSVVPDVVLTWQSKNGVEVSVFESDAAGNAIPPALHRVSLVNGDAQAALDAGTFTVHPTSTTFYLLRVKNRVGSFADKKLKVVVDPPQVLTFQIEPSDVIEGESAQFSWTTKNATGVRFEGLAAAVSRLGNTYVDLSAAGMGGTKAALSGDTALEVINLPSGFTFPFAGTDRTQIQVSTNGWAGFNLTNTGNVSTPGVLPNDSYRYCNFAVFTGDLDSTKGTPAGELWYGSGTDAAGPFFAIQWKNWSWYSSTYNPSVLNFELILRTSGDFEYRYGAMSSNQADHATGVGSSLGFQFPASGAAGLNLVPNSTAVPGGLANTGFAFRTSYPTNGSLSVTPSASATYTLVAYSDDADARKDASVTVWKAPALTSARALPAAPEATKPFRIEWATTNATRVRVLNAAGAELCRATDAAQIAGGSCTLSEPTPGYRTYTVEAIDGIERNVVTRTVAVTVFPLLALDSFAVTPGSFVMPGDSVTLTWAASGASEMQLFSCVPQTNRATCTDITPANASPSGGTLTLTMARSAEFWVRVFDTQYRVRESIRPVWVNAARLNSFGATSTQIVAGGSTTLTWDSSDNATSVSVSGLPVQAPVPSTGTFIDVSGTGTAVALAGGSADSGYFDVPFPDGFVFPWFGSGKTALRASTDGWLGFDLANTTAKSAEQTMPTNSSTYAPVQIAPFWDDLKQGAAPLFYKVGQTPEGVRYLVVQWKNWNFYSSTYNPSDLNFEALLYETGEIEFRYGTMTGGSATYPDWTKGDSQAMGWQSPDTKLGKMLTAAAGDVVSGGLANKSWRFPLGNPPDGSTAVQPSETTEYQACVTNASLFQECQTIRVVVVKPGDVLISEIMAAPGADDAEWFEVRNTAVDPIDIAGWTIGSGTELAVLPASPSIVLQPGGFAVLARSATNGGLAANAVYGNAVTLADAADDLKLFYGGTLIDQVTWTGSGWPVAAGRSMALEPSAMARSTTANDAGTSWCSTAATYGDGTLHGSPGSLGAGCLTADAGQWYVADPVSGMPFIDISTTGVDDSAILAATYYSDMIPLGFAMPFFGDTVTEMQLSKHGYLNFVQHTTYNSTNAALPAASTKPNGMVAPFWDSVATTTGTSSLRHQVLNVGGRNVMIVQWTAISGGAMTYGTLDVQAQLWANGDIVMAYRNVNRLTNDQVLGSSATIGVEDNAGALAVQFWNGSATTGGGPIYNGRSYLLKRR